MAAAATTTNTKKNATCGSNSEDDLCPITLTSTLGMSDKDIFKICPDSTAYNIDALARWVTISKIDKGAAPTWPHMNLEMTNNDLKRLASALLNRNPSANTNTATALVAAKIQAYVDRGRNARNARSARSVPSARNAPSAQPAPAQQQRPQQPQQQQQAQRQPQPTITTGNNIFNQVSRLDSSVAQWVYSRLQNLPDHNVLMIRDIVIGTLANEYAMQIVYNAPMPLDLNNTILIRVNGSIIERTFPRALTSFRPDGGFDNIFFRFESNRQPPIPFHTLYSMFAVANRTLAAQVLSTTDQMRRFPIIENDVLSWVYLVFKSLPPTTTFSGVFNRTTILSILIGMQEDFIMHILYLQHGENDNNPPILTAIVANGGASPQVITGSPAVIAHENIVYESVVFNMTNYDSDSTPTMQRIYTHSRSAYRHNRFNFYLDRSIDEYDEDNGVSEWAYRRFERLRRLTFGTTRDTFNDLTQRATVIKFFIGKYQGVNLMKILYSMITNNRTGATRKALIIARGDERTLIDHDNPLETDAATVYDDTIVYAVFEPNDKTFRQMHEMFDRRHRNRQQQQRGGRAKASSKKVHIGPRGGKYILLENNKKHYIIAG